MLYWFAVSKFEYLNFNDGPILLLERSDAGSTEDHLDAPDLIQVLILHIDSFHLKWLHYC